MGDYDYMSGEDYERLYARYTGRSIDELLLTFGPVHGKAVVDLCCGSGIMGKRALELGASQVLFLDRSHSVMPAADEAARSPDGFFHLATVDVRDTNGMSIARSGRTKYDLVVCRQAVNYWYSYECVRGVLQLLAPGGAFVFNTFNKCPLPVPRIREYEIGGASYVEVDQLVNGTVHHTVFRSGEPPHSTKFLWVERDEFAQVLDHVESVGLLEGWQRVERDRTDIYICVRA